MTDAFDSAHDNETLNAPAAEPAKRAVSEVVDIPPDDLAASLDNEISEGDYADIESLDPQLQGSIERMMKDTGSESSIAASIYITEEDVVDTESDVEETPADVRVNVGQLRRQVQEAGVKDLLDTKLIEKLVRAGKVEVDGIEEFVKVGIKESGDLRQYAVTAGLLTDKEVGQIVTDLTGFKMIDLTDRSVPADILSLITGEFAYQNHVIPLGRTRESGVLMVAIDNPSDLHARELLEALLSDEKQILWRYATKRSLTSALERFYNSDSMGSRLDEIMSDEEFQQDFVVRESDSATTQFVNELILKAHQGGASDIHIEPHEKFASVRLRIDGMLRVTIARFDKALAPQVVAQIKNRAQLRPDERRNPQDGRFSTMISGTKVDFRVATLPGIHGEDIVMRLLDSANVKLSLEQLGMSPKNLERYMSAITKPHGCAFVTGPTGSGKSTTLYASINRIIDVSRKIITVEDPVEYNIEGITQINIARNSAADEKTITFPSALKAAMRSDPDIIIIGEIRDAETASIAIEAAMTGHFVYSSLHTNDALATLDRMQRLGVERFLIAEAVEVLVAQRLVRRLCTECRRPLLATPEYLKGLRAPSDVIKKAEEGFEYNLFRPSEHGCDICGGTGYKGRMGVHEVVPMTEELRDAIIEDQPLSVLESILEKDGIGRLRDDCFEKVLDGRTSMEELARVAV